MGVTPCLAALVCSFSLLSLSCSHIIVSMNVNTSVKFFLNVKKSKNSQKGIARLLFCSLHVEHFNKLVFRIETGIRVKLIHL